MLSTAVLILALQAPGDTLPPPPPGTFLDADAAAMVAGARARTRGANERIAGYDAVARQILSAGMRGFRRDRMLYRRELASRIEWRRDGASQVRVLGARQGSEVAGPASEPFLGEDLRSTAAGLAMDPTTEPLLRIPDEGGAGDADGEPDVFIHPLSPGAEAHYRYRSGESTTIRLPGGRAVRLRELQVLPRRSASNLLSGSLWLEEGTHAAVRGIFTAAAPIRMSFGVEPGQIAIGPFGGIEILSATLDLVTVEYGLWDEEWWLPRLTAMEGRVEIGRFTIPIVFEQRLEAYEVYADGAPVPPPAPADSALYDVARRGCDTTPDATDDAAGEACRERIVLVPRDSASLATSDALLPGSILDGERLTSTEELERLAELASASGWRALLGRTPRFEWNALDAGLFRFNRVEGITVGTTATVEWQPLGARASAWVGHADRSPGFLLELSRRRRSGLESVELYRRLDAFTPEDRPFSLGSSISAFALGHDDGDYYRATGLSLTARQTPLGPARFEGRVYAERQSAVAKHTDLSLRRISGDHELRPNPEADEGDQLGAEAAARLAFGADATGWRFGVEGRMQGERGTYSFARPSGSAYLTFALPGGLVGGLDAAAGTSFGTLPLQRRWYVGGISTVRGVRAEDRISGEAFWRGRVEVGTAFPAARLVLFSDAGWAGERGDLAFDPPLISAGIGVSFLDGILRADLTRTLRGPAGRWGLQLQLDALF